MQPTETREDKVAGFTGAPWSKEAIDKLTELWREGVSPKVISATLRRDEGVVRAKAAELKLPEHADQT
jgi:hypothetical protein